MVNNSSNWIGDGFAVSGLDDLNRAMTELPIRLQTNVMRGAMRAGATVIANDARNRVPVRTGQLKASIRVSMRVSNGTVYAFVKAGSRYTVFKIGKKGVKTKKAYKKDKEGGGVQYFASHYAHFVEFGTVKASAKPFMRPAFDGKAQDAVEAVAEYLRGRIPVELSKLAWGDAHG